VARCTLPLLFKHLGPPPSRYTIIDAEDAGLVAEAARRAREAGAEFVKERVTRENLGEVLARYVGPGDLVVDLSVNVGSPDMVRFCHDCGVLYVNTSIETWPGDADDPSLPAPERALYRTHMSIRRMVEEWGARRGPTAVLDHGANPGLVSHFTRVALQDIAGRWLAEGGGGERAELVKDALDHGAWNRLAMRLGVRVIHISERDTQVLGAPKHATELLNTWSPEAFFAECQAPVEMGWGTHERQLPPRAFRFRRGPRNQICLDAPGVSTRVRTWVPSGEIVGFVIPHSEAFTISEHMTVREGGRALYRPTVHFAYRPCDSALASLFDLIMRDDHVEFRQRVVSDEIVAGSDELGCLLMGHPYNAWWTGSVLDIDEARRLAPHQNATTLQVACSLVAAALWALRNREAGVCVPDDLPHEEILDDAKPYLGKFLSTQVDWTPLQNWREAHAADGVPPPAAEDLWQFSTFLFSGLGEVPAAGQPPAAGGD
jgi:homospermidine synthase